MINSRGSLERNTRQYTASTNLPGAAIPESNEALWSAPASTGLDWSRWGGFKNRASREPKNALREHAVVGGCARRPESNDILVGQVEDLIRERVAVALDPFSATSDLARSKLQDGRCPSAFPERKV